MQLIPAQRSVSPDLEAPRPGFCRSCEQPFWNLPLHRQQDACGPQLVPAPRVHGL